MANSPTTILRPRGLHVERTGVNRARVVVEPLAASHECRSLPPARLDVAQDRLELPFIDRGTYVGARVQAVPDHERRRPRLEPVQEPGGNGFDHHGAARRGAALAR